MSKSLFKFGCIKVLIAVFCFALMTAQIAAAQEGESETSGPENSLRKGAWALQFEIKYLLDIEAFQGFAISGKRHLSDRRAVRLGMGIWLSSSSNDSRYSNPSQGAPPTTRERLEDFTKLDLTSQYILYPSTQKNMNLYLGAGPLIRFVLDDSKAKLVSHDSTDILLDQDISRRYSWTLGLSIVLGVEWFAAKDISFHGEYRISSGYTWEKFRRSDYSPPNRSTTEFTENQLFLRHDDVKLGVSLYF